MLYQGINVHSPVNLLVLISLFSIRYQHYQPIYLERNPIFIIDAAEPSSLEHPVGDIIRINIPNTFSF
jgi:hypothetical protein